MTKTSLLLSTSLLFQSTGTLGTHFSPSDSACSCAQFTLQQFNGVSCGLITGKSIQLNETGAPLTQGELGVYLKSAPHHVLLLVIAQLGLRLWFSLGLVLVLI